MYTRFIKLFAIQGYPLLIVCMLLIGIGVSITSPYLSLYCTERLGMSTGAFGVFMAITSLSGVAVSSLLANRSDRGMNRKRLIQYAAMASGLSFASYLAFHDFWILLIAVTLFTGLGAPVIPQIYAYAQESATESRSEDKAFAMSTLRSLISLGFLIGPLCGTVILGASGYRGLFWGTAAIYAVIAGLVLFFLPRRNIEMSGPAKKRSASEASFGSKRIWLALVAIVFLFVIIYINSINTPLLIVHELHGTHAEVGMVVSISAGLEIPIMLILGALSRKISNHSLMIGACVIGILYYTVLSVSTQPWQIIAAQLLQATFVAIVMGNGLSYFTGLLPDSPGLATTLYSNTSTIGKLLGNLGGGVAAEFTGFRHVNWICIAVALFSFVILWSARPQQRKIVESRESLDL